MNSSVSTHTEYIVATTVVIIINQFNSYCRKRQMFCMSCRNDNNNNNIFCSYLNMKGFLAGTVTES